MRIFRSYYKDVEAIVCQTPKLRAAFLPQYGGKLTSLISLYNGRELLAQAESGQYKKPIYAGSYTDAECSGFDDMLPTIDPYVSTEYPWSGIEYPDHGEVYALNWQYEVLGDSLHMWVYSVRFSYRLDKWITEKEGGIIIAYQLTNLTEFEFNYIYAAHCMLAAQEDAVLELPFADGTKITTVFSNSGDFGTYGSKSEWKKSNFPRFGKETPKDSFKFFFDIPAPQGRCVYRYKDGVQLVFGFDHEALPYFALWVNTGKFKNMNNVALEPCSGTFDRPDIARLYEKYSVLLANSSNEWYVSFDLQQKNDRMG